MSLGELLWFTKESALENAISSGDRKSVIDIINRLREENKTRLSLIFFARRYFNGDPKTLENVEDYHNTVKAYDILIQRGQAYLDELAAPS